jgi:hypothetical protein
VMAEIDDVLSELRHRITGAFESGPPKPARSQHPETNEGGLAIPSLSTPSISGTGLLPSRCAALLRSALTGASPLMGHQSQPAGDRQQPAGSRCLIGAGCRGQEPWQSRAAIRVSHLGNSSSKCAPSQSYPSPRLGHSTKIHRAWRTRLGLRGTCV